MSTVILLDAGPLGLVTNPRGARDALNCRIWLESLLLKGIEVKVPAIADYEVRRSLLLYNKASEIQSLNEWRTRIGYIPVTPDAWLEAARLWAQVRKQGLPTADKNALDADVILVIFFRQRLNASPEQSGQRLPPLRKRPYHLMLTS